ncbi:hypothetical protein EBS43_06495 [bacterium]|nr:hypothetical protein [bacterium]
MIRLILLGSYRCLSRLLVGILWRVFFSEQRRQESLPYVLKSVGASGSSGIPRVWFHASSVGELECISTLIFKAADVGYEIVVTVLSESAHEALHALDNKLKKQSNRVLFVGYCPLEGSWFSALSVLRPSIFVTVKYEAWPDLWTSLTQLEIPLFVISAQMRKSLKIVRSMCMALLGRFPHLFFFISQPENRDSLRDGFPNSQIECVGEPRWDRVYQRKAIGNSRVQELMTSLEKKITKPWGILGSAWLEDLKVLGSQLLVDQGTLWVVPHRVDAHSVVKVCEYLRGEIGLNPICTSNRSQMFRALDQLADSAKTPICIVVDEMGFLSELYAVAAWVFIGGGFAQGVHSTIEPAIYGVPIACGPKGVERFVETGELQKTGQLTVIRDSHGFKKWLTEVVLIYRDPQYQAKWIKDTQMRLGATQKIWDALEKMS